MAIDHEIPMVKLNVLLDMYNSAKYHFTSGFFIFSVTNLRILNFKWEGSNLKNMSYYV
jgi:hypothetical protein